MTGKVRVIVADDHPLFRDGVVRALGTSPQIEVVGTADNGREALDLIREHAPDVALVDYKMPDIDGIGVASAVKRDALKTRVLLLSAHDESEVVYQALQDGAAGFLPKESSRLEIINAVIDVSKGKDVLPPALAMGLIGEVRKRQEPFGPSLSEREKEVLGYIAKGMSIPAMGKHMFLAPSTVKTHVQRLYEKLGVADRGAAVAEAMRRKLLD
ncbi:MAG: response regulator transcription factor [Nocardiaceae bacterium]|nr:response regulator transcription factor [Nocardiaceae bacterium]